MRLEFGFRIAPNWPKLEKWQWRHNFPTWRHRQIFLTLLFSPSVMSLSSRKLWRFLFIRNWPEIWKLEIPLSEFCPISGDWGKLGIPNLARTFLIKCYWMLQNARVTANSWILSIQDVIISSATSPASPTIRGSLMAQELFHVSNHPSEAWN